MVSVNGSTQLMDSTVVAPNSQVDSTAKQNPLPQNLKPVQTKEQGVMSQFSKGEKVELSKNLLSHGLIGGTGATVINLIGKAGWGVPIKGVTTSTALYGAGVGAGVALLRAADGDDPQAKQIMTRLAGTAIIGTSGFGLIESAAKTTFQQGTAKMWNATPHGLLLGAALGTGVGLVITDFENETVNTTAKVVGSGMVGAATLGSVNAMIRTGVNEKFLGASPTALAIGAGALGGTALLLVETEHNDAKNVVAGAILGATGAGFLETVAKTIGYDSVAAGKVTAGSALAGASIGAGILVLNMDTENELLKNATGGAMIGAGAGAIVESIARVAANDAIAKAAMSKLGVGIGIAAGVGLAIVLTD